jgi:hypothetical protein
VQAVGGDVGRDGDDAGHQVGAATGEGERHDAAVAVADELDGTGPEGVEQLGRLVGHQVVRVGAVHIGGAPVAPAVGDDDPAGPGEGGRDVGPGRAVLEAAVQEHHRRAAADVDDVGPDLSGTSVVALVPL